MLFGGIGAWISANASSTLLCQSHSLCFLHFQEEKLSETAPGVSVPLYTEGDEHICRINGLWWHPSDPEKVADTPRDNRAGWQTGYLKYLNPALAFPDQQQGSHQPVCNFPSQAEQKGKTDMDLVSAAVCRSVSSAFTIQGMTLLLGLAFRMEGRSFMDTALSIKDLPLSRRVKSINLQWWYW